MSFRHPSPTKTPRRRPPSPPTSTPDSPSGSQSTKAHLIEIARYPHQPRPRKTKHLFLPSPVAHLVLPGRTRLTQVLNPNSESPSRRRRPTAGEDDAESAVNSIFDNVFISPTLDSDLNHHRRKENQFQKWTTEIIPSLLRPYWQLLRETDNLRNRPDDNTTVCTCGSPGRPIHVVVVYSDRAPLSSSLRYLLLTLRKVSCPYDCAVVNARPCL